MRRAKAAAPAIHPYVQELLAQLPLASAQPGRAFVLASSAEAATALRNAVCLHRPALLGVRFVAPAAFVRELLWLLGEPATDELLAPLAERRLLRDVLARTRSEVAAYARRHRASLDALLQTCREWLRAGAPAPQKDLSPWGRDTLAIARAFAGELRSHPIGSRVQLVARARDLLDRGVQPSRAILVAIAGQTSGDIEALLDLLGRTANTTCVRLSGAGSAPARSRSVHQSVDSELRATAHRCALWFAGGLALGDIIVAAPRLGPYLPFVAGAFATEGIPLRARAETPLAHEPRGALAVHATRLLFDGAPARSYLALLASELRREPLPPDAQLHCEQQARQLGLSGHGALPERVAAALADSAPLAATGLRCLALRARQANQALSARDKARALADLMANELAPPAAGTRDAQATACLAAALAELEHADDGEFLLDALDWLQGRGLPISASDGDAVQLVEYADALAFPAAHVSLLGASDDQLPQPAPAPTYFDAADREALDLAPRAATRQHEVELVRRLLALPMRSLHTSRPQTDAQGRPVGASSLVVAAMTDVPEVAEPAHPLPRAAARVASGLASLDAAVVDVALRHGSASAASQLLGARGNQAIQRVLRLERFVGDLACDGDVGVESSGSDERALSVSDLESLASCAHRFFFRRVLRLTPLPPEPDPLALAPAAVGSAVHKILAELHPRLATAAAGSDEVDTGALAAELSPRLDGLLSLTSPLPFTLPALHRILVRQWSHAIALAFADDVRTLRTYAITPLHQELAMTGHLDLGDDRGIAVRGRADRVDRLASGAVRVIDYKTGGNPGNVLSPSDTLKGRRLQMPAYTAMAQQTLGADVQDVGVRAVRPDLTADGEFWLKWRYAGDFLDGKLTAGLRETLRVLADVRARGTYVPSMDADKVCRFCDFRSACRRLHPPSRDRIWNTDRPEVLRYLGLRSKSFYAPMLADRDAP